MPKSALTAAFAVMMMATAPVAFAQNTTTDQTPAATPAPARPMAPTMTERSADRATTGTTQKAATSFKTPAGDLRAAEIIGSTVYDVHNRNIGSVKDIVLDKDGKVSNVVVDVGAFLGMGGKYVAVALNDIKMDNDRLTLNRTKEELEAAKEFQLQPKNG